MEIRVMNDGMRKSEETVGFTESATTQFNMTIGIWDGTDRKYHKNVVKSVRENKAIFNIEQLTNLTVMIFDTYRDQQYDLPK
jgi:hypothetical protein